MPAASKRPARLSAASAAVSLRSHSWRVSCRAAASAAASSCKSATIRPSRSTSSRSDASCCGLGSATPSSSASCPACKIAIGVRSSCATSATRSRRSCSWRSRVSAIPSNAVASSRSSPVARTGPTRADRSPRLIARVTAMMRPTGPVIRRAMTSAVIRASRAASPAAPAIARSSEASRARSAPASPALVNRVSTVPTVAPLASTGALYCWAPRSWANPGEDATTAPALSRTCTSAPGPPRRPTRSSTGPRSACAQLSSRSQAALAATATAVVRSARWRCTRARTSEAASAAVRIAASPTAASATARNASASRSASVVPPPAVCAAWSVIATQAEPVPPAEHRRDDLRAGRIGLNLAPQVLYVRVDGALIALELITPYPVDQLESRIHPAGHGCQGHEDAPLGRRQVDARAPHPRLTPWFVKHEHSLAISDRALHIGLAAPAQDCLHPQHELSRAERLGDVVVCAELETPDPVLLGALRGQQENRRPARGPYLARDRLARYVRQPEVQDNKIGSGRRGQGERLSSRVG